MVFYRLESQLDQIGVLLDTDTRDNMARTVSLKDPYRINILNSVVNYSLQTGVSLQESWFRHKSVDVCIDAYIQHVWELLFEHARPEGMSIRHYDCAYFFTDKVAAVQYRKYPGMKDAVLCEVEIIETYDSILRDMQWLEMLNENTATASECIETLKHYWAGEMTPSPIEEILFLGKYKLNPII